MKRPGTSGRHDDSSRTAQLFRRAGVQRRGRMSCRTSMIGAAALLAAILAVKAAAAAAVAAVAQLWANFVARPVRRAAQKWAAGGHEKVIMGGARRLYERPALWEAVLCGSFCFYHSLARQQAGEWPTASRQAGKPTGRV